MKRLPLLFATALLTGGLAHSAYAGVTCPNLISGLPPTTTNTPIGPSSPAVIDIILRALYNHYYNSWTSRISLPDIASSSSPNPWANVSEFAELVRTERFLPYVVEGLRSGDFRLVPVIECITKIDSLRLYPNPMPPIGQFGMQDVAQLWGSQGGQLYESVCRTRCAGDAACELQCIGRRQRAWGP